MNGQVGTFQVKGTLSPSRISVKENGNWWNDIDLLVKTGQARTAQDASGQVSA